MKKCLAVLLLPALLFAVTAVPAQASHHEKMDIVDTAAGNDAFSTLVTAVKAAGLVDLLKGEGPYTVFAPTNEAFEALPEGALEALLKPENKEQLVRVLAYHVVPGKLMAEQVVATPNAKSLTGDKQLVEFSVKDEKAYVNDATIVKTDVAASNGVIHVIDKVILPEELPNIVEAASSNDSFSTLVAAVKAAGLVDVLSGDDMLTVFAPTDEAFAKLPEDTLNSLLQPENKEKLQAILTYHVVPGKIIASEAVKADEVETVNGAKAPIEVSGDSVTIGGANIVATDIDVANGVIHVIDSVIMPPSDY